MHFFNSVPNTKADIMNVITSRNMLHLPKTIKNYLHVINQITKWPSNMLIRIL